MSNTEINAAEFRDGSATITPDKFKICLRTYHIDEEEKLIIDDKTLNDEVTTTFNANVDTDSQEISLFGYKFIITRHRVNHYDIGKMSNGTF